MPNFVAEPKLWQPDASRRFNGPVAVLTSGATYSAAEDFALAYEGMARGPIVGFTVYRAGTRFAPWTTIAPTPAVVAAARNAAS